MKPRHLRLYEILNVLQRAHFKWLQLRRAYKAILIYLVILKAY